MLVHISVYIEDVYMNVKIHMIHSIYILANDCICNMHISRYLHTPLHKHNCIHAYLEAICPLIWGPNPCFFPIKKRSFGFHGLQGYVYHTLTNCIAQISNVDSYLLIPPQCKGNDPSIRRFCCHQHEPVATVARTLHPLRRSPERYSPL